MNGSHTRNTVPVETFLLPSASSRSHNLPRSCGKNLQTSMCKVTAIEITSQIMLGRPKIAGMSASHCRPVTATLHRGTTIPQRQISLRIRFGPETFLYEPPCNLFLLCIGYLRHILRFLAIGRSTGHQAQISGCHFFVKFRLSIGSSRHSHHCIMHRHQFPLSIGMTPGQSQWEVQLIAIKTHGK